MLKKTDQEIIKGYLEDSSNLTGGFADGVYLPENETDIVAALKECSANKTPLTVSAGQTGTTGGCIPFGGWGLSTQKLNKIINIDVEQKSATIQPGVTLEELEKAVSREGLLYPPDPTEKSATLGGNVATNASGGRCYRFGSTRNWVRRLKIILVDGTAFNLKRDIMMAQGENFKLPHLSLRIPHYQMPLTKNSAGYFSAPGMDLVDLFIGMEGTLGIVSEIEVGLVPRFEQTFDLVAFFPTEELAVDFVAAAKAAKDTTINFFEFFDANTLAMLKPDYPKIPANAKAAIYIEQEGVKLEFWAGLLEKFQASIDNSWIGHEELTKFRHAIPEHINDLFKQHQQIKLATDIAVPEDKFKEMLNYYNLQLTTYNSQLSWIKFGHIGDNHLHVNLLAKTAADLPLAKELIMKFVKKAVSLGGTVSAEHGIGKIKRDYLSIMYGEAGIKEMKRIKETFDPHRLLGLDNIFRLS